MAVNTGVKVTVKNVDAIAKLRLVVPRVRREIRDAVDVVLALVQKLARSQHPKIPDSVFGAAAASARPLTGPRAGPFAFMKRFLTRTGNLRNSIRIKRARIIGPDIIGIVFSAIEYADRIEFGSPRNPAYPFLRPALISASGPAVKILAAASRSANR